MKQNELAVEPKVASVLYQVEVELKMLLGDKLKKVILYGSYSRGDYVTESDIDIIALVDEPQPDERYEEDILEIMVDLSIKYDVVLSLFLESEMEYEEAKTYKPFLKRIEKEGIEIYAA